MTSGLLFDLINPAPSVVSPSLPAPERQRLNAAALRVLAFLQRHGEATNVELCDPAIGGLGGIRRVWELKQSGYDIQKQHVVGGLWRYRLASR